MRRSISLVLAGLVAGVALATAAAAAAYDIAANCQVVAAKFVFNGGAPVTPQVANGNPPAFICNGTTYVPARFLAQQLGQVVGWDGSTDTVSVGSGGSSSSTSSTPAALLKVSGSGTKTTQTFTVPANWDLNWTYDCSSFGNQGNFQVFVYNADGSPDFNATGVNELGANGSDTEYYHGDGGTKYLVVNSECTWTVVATAG